MSSALAPPLAGVITLLVLGILCFQGLIDLEWAIDLGPWHANAPWVDLLALALLPLAVGGRLLGTRRARENLTRALSDPPLPGIRGAALLGLACALSIATAVDSGAALHHLLRKPLFMYVVYAGGLAWAVARVVPTRVVLTGMLAYVLGTSLLSLASSAQRIVSGDALWFQAIAGLTPNHKTLAVALAAWLPLLAVAGSRLPRSLKGPSRVILVLMLTAIAASFSRTAWITTLFGIGLFFPRLRPFSTRPRLVLPTLAAALLAASMMPLLLESKVMLDAARSRHSLNKRAWQMFVDHPLVGSGTGMNTVIEQVIFPHYRVNGVDAHGAIQKVGSETGLLGLAGFGWMTWATGTVLLRRSRQDPPQDSEPSTGHELVTTGLDYGLLGTWMALHVNLLLSTETFSPTHWVPLTVCWGLSHRATSLDTTAPMSTPGSSSSQEGTS
ncbi:MAG: O-antigen ligase family protein [Myxococcota bacterium]|nr:O-antigen ligase family protein [Myxococcota bacterium]